MRRKDRDQREHQQREKRIQRQKQQYAEQMSTIASPPPTAIDARGTESRSDVIGRESRAVSPSGIVRECRGAGARPGRLDGIDYDGGVGQALRRVSLVKAHRAADHAVRGIPLGEAKTAAAIVILVQAHAEAARANTLQNEAWSYSTL